MRAWAGLDDEASKAGGLVVSHAPGIHPGGDAGAGRDRIGFDAEAVGRVEAVRVEVDEAGRDVEAGGVDHLDRAVGRDGVFDGGDGAVQNGQVLLAVQRAGRIEQRSAPNQQVETALIGLRKGCGGQGGEEVATRNHRYLEYRDLLRMLPLTFYG
jgi:hypothetical protein